MVEVLLFAFFLIGGIYCLASIANAWQRKKLEETEPLLPLDEESVNSCKLHTWRELTLLKPEEIEAYKSDPAKFRPSTYCESCGYVPSMQMQVSKRFRDALKEQEALIRQAQERAKEIEALSEEFYKTAREHFQVGEGQESIFRAGYEAYAQFVAVLPELVERNRVKKIMERLKPGTDQLSN